MPLLFNSSKKIHKYNHKHLTLVFNSTSLFLLAKYQKMTNGGATIFRLTTTRSIYRKTWFANSDTPQEKLKLVQQSPFHTHFSVNCKRANFLKYFKNSILLARSTDQQINLPSLPRSIMDLSLNGWIKSVLPCKLTS